MPSPSTYSSYGANATANVKAIGGRVMRVVLANRNAVVRYFQLFDSTGSTGGAVVFQCAVPASGVPFTVPLSDGLIDGHQFATGITYGFSTTSGSYVAATAGESDVYLQYF